MSWVLDVYCFQPSFKFKTVGRPQPCALNPILAPCQHFAGATAYRVLLPTDCIPGLSIADSDKKHCIGGGDPGPVLVQDNVAAGAHAKIVWRHVRAVKEVSDDLHSVLKAQHIK